MCGLPTATRALRPALGPATRPKTPPGGAAWTGKASRPWSEAAARPWRLHYGSCPRERGWSPAGSAVRRCQPRPPLSRRVLASAAPSLLPAALLARGSQSHSSHSLPLRFSKVFFLPEEKIRLYPEALYSFRTPLSQASTGSSPRAFVLLFICHY